MRRRPPRTEGARRYNENRARERESSAQFAAEHQAFAPPRNQIAELPQLAFETTGVPSIARAQRGYEDAGFMRADPQARTDALQGANEQAIWGALSAAGWAVPSLRGRAPPPRAAARATPQRVDMVNLARAVNRGLDRSDADFLANIDGTPEQALGRPLTPDHIWNDPRFQYRYDRTADLEGMRTPAERFDIAGERFGAQRANDGVNDLDQWSQSRAEMLPSLIERQRTFDDGYGHGFGPTKGMSIEDIIASPELRNDLDSYLGPWSVGGPNEHTPLLGTPDVAADPMVARRPPGLPPNRPPPMLRAPNEDRYLFGRPQPELRPTQSNAAPLFDLPFFRPNWSRRPVEPMAEMEWLQGMRRDMRGQQDAYESRILPYRWEPGDTLSERQMLERAEQLSRAVGEVDRRLDELRASQGLPTRLDEAFSEARGDAADGMLSPEAMSLPRRGTVVQNDGSLGPYRPPRPPDGAKSYRPKPPSGGFFMPGAR